MKKNLLLIIFLILSSFARAQHWCPPGAVWHYRDLNSNPATFKDGSVELAYTGTVVLNNITCKVITGKFYGASEWMDQNVYTIDNYVIYRTYEDNGVVYLFNVSTQGFDTIADFNAHIGESWFYADNSQFCADLQIPRTKVTVYDTGHVTINNHHLKKIVISPPADTLQRGFIERIGGFPGYLFFKQDCALDGSTLGNFACYQDSTFPLYRINNATICMYTTVSIRENSLIEGSLKLYPNPGNGELSLELQQPARITISDALGAIVYQGNFEFTGNFKIDLSGAAPGMYYLKAGNSTGNAYIKLVKE